MLIVKLGVLLSLLTTTTNKNHFSLHSISLCFLSTLFNLTSINLSLLSTLLKGGPRMLSQQLNWPLQQCFKDVELGLGHFWQCYYYIPRWNFYIWIKIKFGWFLSNFLIKVSYKNSHFADFIVSLNFFKNFSFYDKHLILYSFHALDDSQLSKHDGWNLQNCH